MFKGLNHIAIAVRNLDDALNYFAEVFGIEKPSRIEVLPDQGVKACLMSFGRAHIELLEPLSPDSTVARFIERQGEKMHHLCFETDDIETDLKVLAAKGIESIDPVPRPGLEGTVAFLHPRSTRGILIELLQKQTSRTSTGGE